MDSTSQEHPEKVLLAVVNKVLEFSSEGKQAKAQHILPFVYESVTRYPQLLWNSPEIWKLAKALLVMHHYDLVEEEDDEMRIVQMALVYAQRAIELCEANADANRDDYFNALHTQILLFSSCAEYFESTIAELYSKTVMSAEERAVALRMASHVMPMMSYNVVVKVDDAFDNFNGDDYIAELCAQFEQEHPDARPEQLEDAKKIHRLLIRDYLKFFK